MWTNAALTAGVSNSLHGLWRSNSVPTVPYEPRQDRRQATSLLSPYGCIQELVWRKGNQEARPRPVLQQTGLLRCSR